MGPSKDQTNVLLRITDNYYPITPFPCWTMFHFTVYIFQCQRSVPRQEVLCPTICSMAESERVDVRMLDGHIKRDQNASPFTDLHITTVQFSSTLLSNSGTIKKTHNIIQSFCDKKSFPKANHLLFIVYLP